MTSPATNHAHEADFVLNPLALIRRDRDPFAMTKSGEALRNDGNILEAAVSFTRLRRQFPNLPYGLRELANLRARAGDLDGAARDLDAVFALDRQNLLSLTQLVRHLVGMGQLELARERLADFVPPSEKEDAQRQVLLEFVAFMERHPKREALRFLSELSYGGRYLPTAFVEDALKKALLARTPFSLIRLGDGEGAWISDPDEAGGRYRALYEENRRRTLQRWFADESPTTQAGIQELRSRFLDSVDSADLIGIPYPTRIRHEVKIASPDGYPACINVLRHVEAGPELAPAGFCTHDIHLDLHLSGALNRLMDASSGVGIISCHPGLSVALARRGVRVEASILVPQEMMSADVIGETGFRVPHYPVAFGHALARIEARPWPGVLWLVAAGFLGKIYCDAVARMGGVALDIGSVADAWMGKVTRPGLSDLTRYRL